MPKEMPDQAPGSEREKRTDQGDFFSSPTSREFPTYPQTAFSFDLNEKRKGRTLQFYAVVGAMFRLWAKWINKEDPLGEWAKALNKAPSYASKLSAGLNRHEGRFVQIDWVIPLLECPEAEDLWMDFNSEVCRREPSVKKREITPEQAAQAEREVIDELPEELREMIRARKAKKLGVRLEDLKR